MCGPRRNADGGTDRLVRFFTGAWGEQEWECVELAMRFMYLAYGVSPYSANGMDVYANYSTGRRRRARQGRERHARRAARAG